MEHGRWPILILFCHPRFEQSRVNRALLSAVTDLPFVRIHDLYEAYPDFNILVEQEKSLLLSAQVIIWQHPFYMYGAPALLKQWMDLVLEFGWAHGSEGIALKDKWALNCVTTGGARESYQEGGRNRFPLGAFLAPFSQTAVQCKMVYQPPFAVQGTYLLTDADLSLHAARYRFLLTRLSQGDVGVASLQGFADLNDWVALNSGETEL